MFNLNAAAMQPLVDKGAIAYAPIVELAARCEIVLLCLPTSDHVHAVLLGENGMAATALVPYSSTSDR